MKEPQEIAARTKPEGPRNDQVHRNGRVREKMRTRRARRIERAIRRRQWERAVSIDTSEEA